MIVKMIAYSVRVHTMFMTTTIIYTVCSVQLANLRNFKIVLRKLEIA